jgi:hypothetical protein
MIRRLDYRDNLLVNLSIAVITINGWNRLAIPFRSVPGSYQPAAASRHA